MNMDMNNMITCTPHRSARMGTKASKQNKRENHGNVRKRKRVTHLRLGQRFIILALLVNLFNLDGSLRLRGSRANLLLSRSVTQVRMRCC